MSARTVNGGGSGTRARLIGAAVSVALLSTIVVAPIGATAAPNKTWARFLADRNEFYETLAPAFVSCFQRRDSLIDPGSPIFHGCYDWHSAVHAGYSHHVLYRRTGEQEYLDLAQAQIAPEGVSLVPAEEAYTRAKAPDYLLTENPYGFGWLLVFARERELATGQKDFRALADFAAEQMVSWFEERTARGDGLNFILDRAHENYSWSLINLDVWARYTQDADLKDAVMAAGEALLNPGLDKMCPAKLDRTPEATGFQPACLMRVAAVAQIWGDHATDWVKARIPKTFKVPPVTDPANCHAGGLNFTRAFALYRIYEVTGKVSYRDNYADLIRYHVGRPDLYMGEQYLGNPDYLCYSHWVAQVGVRTISLSHEPPPSPPVDDLPRR